MRLDPSPRRRLWLQNQLFTLLFGLVIGLLAWLSTRYPMQADWTANGRNTLSAASQTLLARMDGPIRVTAYVREQSAPRDAIARLIGRYQRHKPDLTLRFANPDLTPDRTRELGITQESELYVEYRGRGAKLQQLGEQSLTQALQRLSRPQEQVVLFLDGHGERKPLGIANHDLGAFGRELEKIGIRPRPLDLAAKGRVPVEAAALVIAGPQLPLSPDVVEAIVGYVRQGGHLLWLLEPDDPSNLQPLAAALGIARWPGVVVDADAPSLGIKNPAFVPIADYGPHPITETLRAPALLPMAAAMNVRSDAGWTVTALLESQSRSWTETGPLDGPLRFDPDRAERPGPLTVGVALVRPRPGLTPDLNPPAVHRQRVVVIGDGDFLSNTYLGNGANLELGLNIFNWLTLDEPPILIAPRTTPDPDLNLSEGALALIAATFLVGLPGMLLICGWLIWFRRRRW
ncbi:MAG: GldG family protein [Candidatus Contendobacter sp.]|nr:GldG family protein [Candidatus Contendobacter sp.]MDG4556391.1 GldG family protein [Candidatus Contendobacter sp.]